MDLSLTAVVLLLFCPVATGITDYFDVVALEKLFNSLNYSIPGGNDPCGSGSAFIICNGGKIIEIHFSGHVLNGDLGDSLNEFRSITTIDLKNNSIYGNISSNLPLTLQHLDLSDNHLDGAIPKSLGSLAELQTLSLSRNQLQGSIPNSFHSLTMLTDLYLSNNYLGGELPGSMASLASLTTLHLQNNMLSGKLDVLQGLPLHDLNIENNLFPGPIPAPLFLIPLLNFSGNPISVGSSSPPSSPPSPPSPPSPVLMKPSPPVSPKTPRPAADGTPALPPKPVDVPFNVGTRPPPGVISLASVSAPPPWSLPLIKAVSFPPKQLMLAVVVGLILLVLVCIAFMVRRGPHK